MNGPAWHADLGGADYQIFGVRLHTDPRWINTDGFDLHARNVHLRGVDVLNGDDSICIKAPAHDVLVEDSVVRQGNGLVVGTSDPVAISNITFRNCTAIQTSFGCHIKFKGQQTGHVSWVVFEDITILDPVRTHPSCIESHACMMSRQVWYKTRLHMTGLF